MSTTEMVQRASREAVTIEKLAAALEKASTVDDIKDVRDRAMAIQLYTRKKKGGLQAAQAAGRVVTHATLMLAKLYAEETSSARATGTTNLDREQGNRPGKVAIARAAEMDPAALSRLQPVVNATPKQIARAEAAIEERGDVVTPNSLLRELVPPTPPPPPRDILKGKDPEDFKIATRAIGNLKDMAAFVEGADVAAVLRGSSARERAALVDHARVIHAWMARIIKGAANG